METFTRMFSRILLAVLFVQALSRTNAADFSVKSAEAPPPKEIAESIRAVLDPKAIQLVREGKPVLEIWLRREVPLKANSAKLNSLRETTLLGAVAVRETLRDYKDNEVAPGIYTARFILQPQDGDHLGSADFNTFLALVPASTDKDLEGISKYTALTKASGKITPSGHPAVFNLRPVSGETTSAPAVTEPAPEHKAIRLSLDAKGPGGEKVALPFDLVFEGHGHIQ